MASRLLDFYEPAVAPNRREKQGSTYDGNSRGSEPRADGGGDDDSIAARRGFAPFVGEELGNASGEELPLPAVTNDGQSTLGYHSEFFLRANKGFFLFGVLRPTALLAIIPATGELGAAELR